MQQIHLIILVLLTLSVHPPSLSYAEDKQEFSVIFENVLKEAKEFNLKEHEHFSVDLYPKVQILTNMVTKSPDLTIQLLSSDDYYSNKLALILLAEAEIDLNNKVSGYLLGLIVRDNDYQISKLVFYLIENCKVDNWFTERIIESAAKSTIPGIQAQAKRLQRRRRQEQPSSK